MGDSKVLLSEVGNKIALAVRNRALLDPKTLAEILGGSNPVKDTRDLLQAGVFLDGDEREVVADVLRSTDQSARVKGLFEFAATNAAGEVQTFAASILATHKDAVTVYDLVTCKLSGVDQNDAAVALAVAGKHSEVKKIILAFVSDAGPSEDSSRVVIALRFRSFLAAGAIDTRFDSISAHDLLIALPVLVPSEEAKLLSKFLRSKAKGSQLFDEAVAGTEGAYDVLVEHTETNAVVRIIGLKLNDSELDHITTAQRLLADRRNDVLGNADVVPSLFDAAAKGVDGAFDALVSHTKVDAVWHEVKDAHLKNAGNENLDRQKVARALIAQRADLQQKLSAAIGVEVKAPKKSDTSTEKPANAQKSSHQPHPSVLEPAEKDKVAEENAETKG